MTTSNIKFKTGSKESPTEPFKRAVTGCLRAIARKPDLEVTYAAERHGAIETRAPPGVAGAGSHLLDLDPDRVLVAVDAHLDDTLHMAGTLALAPQALA
jgi:hypothetical protein